MKGPMLAVGLLLVLIWIVIPAVPASWGLRFGRVYQGFLSAAVLAPGLFYGLLGRRPARRPPSPLRALAGVVLVYLTTVGAAVVVGFLYPQFDVPRAAKGKDTVRAEARGKELFVSKGCIGCHSIQTLGVRGGTRAPDLSDVARRAATRIPGVPAEEYIREHITRGSDPKYFTVPGYPPIMPPFGQTLTEEQLRDLVAYLLAARGK